MRIRLSPARRSSVGYEFGNDPAKIEGYRKFWNRDEVKRPLVGFHTHGWFPKDEYRVSAAWEKDRIITPADIDPEQFLDDEERFLRAGEVMADDVIRGASPSQAVHWCCATLGCRLRAQPGNIVSEDKSLPWEQVLGMKVDLGGPWFSKYLEYADALVKRADGRFPVSHSILFGPLDYAVALRGHEQIVMDMFDEPENVARFLHEMGDVFISFTDTLWQRLPKFHGGYFDAQYGLWSPGPIARMQEDAIAVMSPTLYEEFIRPVDERIGARYDNAFIHLHATSMIVLDQLLDMPEIKALEINHDVGGPAVEEMIPNWQKVQAAGKPMIIRGAFTTEETRKLMDSLEPEGLYLHMMVDSVKDTEPLRPLLGM